MKYLFSICAIAALALGIQLSIADDATKVGAGSGKCPLSSNCASATGAEVGSACAKECSEKCASECASKCEGKEGACASQCSEKCAEKCSSQCAEKCSSTCEKSCAENCSGEKCSGEKCASGQSVCCATLAAAKKQLPQMSYLVGTEKVCCSEMASELAEKSQEKVQFVVADKTYCCKEAAFTALVEETEKFVNAFVAPSKCEASGVTKVAGKQYDCCQAAAKQTELVSTAVKTVRMEYKVGDEEVCCIKHATTLAKDKGVSIQYVVDGEATECELSARLKLATAKYIAAVSAAAKAEMTVDATAAIEKVASEQSGS